MRKRMLRGMEIFLERHYKLSLFITAIISLAWFIYRTGSKPSRINYPCQKVALSNVSVFLTATPLVVFFNGYAFFRKNYTSFKTTFMALTMMGVIMISVLGVAHLLNDYPIKGRYVSVHEKKVYGVALGGGLAGYMTIPSAMALPSPHRVVSVHDSNATNWDGGGSPHNHLIQAAIDRMVDKGIRELAQNNDSVAAWSMIIPYQEGEVIAIKLNFNNVWSCAPDHWNSDHYMNPYAELINSIIAGLKSIGVPSENIWLTDPSRLPVDTFRSRISDPNVKYYTKCTPAQIDGRANVHQTTFVGDGSPHSSVTEAAPGVFLWVNPAQVFVDADHIINVPQLKGHGGASITLGLKNHFGSVSFTENAWGHHFTHDYFYSTTDRTQYNLLGDMNNNPVFKNKTRLIVGDGLMGHSTINYVNPHTWVSFGGNPPEILFFGVDPIAVDSVMADYLKRENAARGQATRNLDLLVYSARLGLGIFEQWNNNDDREYTTIGYVEVDFDTGLCKNCFTVDSGENPDPEPEPQDPIEPAIVSVHVPENTTLTGIMNLSMETANISSAMVKIAGIDNVMEYKGNGTYKYSRNASGYKRGSYTYIMTAVQDDNIITFTGAFMIT